MLCLQSHRDCENGDQEGDSCFRGDDNVVVIRWLIGHPSPRGLIIVVTNQCVLKTGSQFEDDVYLNDKLANRSDFVQLLFNSDIIQRSLGTL